MLTLTSRLTQSPKSIGVISSVDFPNSALSMSCRHHGLYRIAHSRHTSTLRTPGAKSNTTLRLTNDNQNQTNRTCFTRPHFLLKLLHERITKLIASRPRSHHHRLALLPAATCVTPRCRGVATIRTRGVAFFCVLDHICSWNIERHVRLSSATRARSVFVTLFQTSRGPVRPSLRRERLLSCPSAGFLHLIRLQRDNFLGWCIDPWQRLLVRNIGSGFLGRSLGLRHRER